MLLCSVERLPWLAAYDLFLKELSCISCVCSSHLLPVLRQSFTILVFYLNAHQYLRLHLPLAYRLANVKVSKYSFLASAVFGKSIGIILK